jgi:hypothetical protein
VSFCGRVAPRLVETSENECLRSSNDGESQSDSATFPKTHSLFGPYGLSLPAIGPFPATGPVPHFIGGNLAPGQRVFFLVYNPGVEPSESAKASARNRIHQLLNAARDHVQQLGVTDSQAEAAVEEAIRSIEE